MWRCTLFTVLPWFGDDLLHPTPLPTPKPSPQTQTKNGLQSETAHAFGLHVRELPSNTKEGEYVCLHLSPSVHVPPSPSICTCSSISLHLYLFLLQSLLTRWMRDSQFKCVHKKSVAKPSHPSTHVSLKKVCKSLLTSQMFVRLDEDYLMLMYFIIQKLLKKYFSEHINSKDVRLSSCK